MAMIPESEVLDVREPPGKAMGKVAELWKPVEGTNKILCTACARYCKIGEGQVGLCGIRGVHQGKLWLYVYGRVITGHVDPIEKKPVSHFRPGSKIFSIATTGCNWLCNPAGSEILMADGDHQVVEEIRPDDALWSIDEATLRPTLGIVTGVGRRRAQTFRVSVRGLAEPVLATGDHPVLTSSGWREIADLGSGALVLVSTRTSDSAFRPTKVSKASPHAQEFHPESVAALERLACREEFEPPVLEWHEVQSIRPQGPPEIVYSFECIPSHTYICNGITLHNCRYCQNADISQRRKVEGIEVEPQDVVRMTVEQGCQGLAYTYNQPTIFIEFARDIGMLARKAGLINIFVSNGYDTPETVAEMPKFLDCVTVDFKGSGETNFVRKYINIPNADPIFQTLLDTRDTKKIHIEITDLIVPQVGDDLGAARKLSKWVYDNLGPDTPIHFLRFHPDYKMMEFPWTPVETLEKHCAVAKEEGLKYVYIGNVSGHPLENTYCPGCGAIAIKRYGFDITGWYLDKDNKCKKCGYHLAILGRLEKTAKENRFYSVLDHR
jgi:pyruvate formate lyase activating enzyme